MRQYGAALEREQGTHLQIGNAKRSLPGSFSALCVSYYATPEFRDLKENTKRVRRNILERFRAEHGHRRVKDLQRAHINTLLGTMHNRPEAANNLLKVLRVVLKHAVDDNWIENNPALGVQRYRSRNQDGRHTWTESEIAQFQVTHPINSRAGFARALHRPAALRPTALGLAARERQAHRSAPAEDRNGDRHSDPPRTLARA
jgi:hypothetical protein